MNTGTTLPRSLFVSHGAPTLALADSPTGRFLDRLGGQLPRPRAIVVASAHYAACVPALGSAARPETIHDFSGFPPPLYAIDYPAAGEPSLAATLTEALRDAGFSARLDPERGLDHGVWVPLLRMYPDAGIPVIPLSVLPRESAETHFRMGMALANALPDDVLLLGSGGSVHNLGDLEWQSRDGSATDWARAFADWLSGHLASGDIDALLDWERQAPNARHAHPTTEHLMPLFVALGAAGRQFRSEPLHRDFEFGSLAMQAFAFRSAA
ncbi:MAG: dioxygenase [Rhodanobacteraceae bacterium]|nr:dioxygenase [Rhodanobacteraceae bacterium]HPF74088.1 class III extradiol ring-cleavage dioxygenase [Xanthomonadaceae bacterium]